MAEIELILEIPAVEDGPSEFPDAALLPWVGGIGRTQGLNGQECLQLAILVGAPSVRILRTWLLTRAERLKQSRVVWDGQTYEGYTPKEIERLIRLLERRTGGEPGSAAEDDD